MTPENKDKLIDLLTEEAFNSGVGSVDYFTNLVREGNIPKAMTFEAISVLDKNPNVAARNLVDWAIGKGTNPEQPTFTVLGNLIYPLLTKIGLETIRFLATLSLRDRLIAPQTLKSIPEISQHVDPALWSELEPSTDGGVFETLRQSSKPDPLASVKQRQKIWRSLNDLPDVQLEQVIFNLKAYKLPSGNVPSAQSPKASRVAAVFEWAESSVGCGLDTLQKVVEFTLKDYQQS